MSNLNYFKILNISEEYDINLKELEDNYLELQKKFHPDNFADSSEKISKMNFSIDLNNGYKILKDNFKRANHLLKINGYDIEREGSNKIKLPFEILTHIFEKRELVDDSVDKNFLEKIISSSYEEKKSIEKDIFDLLTSDNFAQAAILLMQVKYINNLIEAAEDKLSNL